MVNKTKAQAEARLAIPITSPLTLDLSPTTEFPWQLMSNFEPHANCERAALVRNHLPVMESSLDGFDRCANPAKEAQDSSGIDFDW